MKCLVERMNKLNLKRFFQITYERKRYSVENTENPKNWTHISGFRKTIGVLFVQKCSLEPNKE